MISKDLKFQVVTIGHPNLGFQRAYTGSGYNAEITFCVCHIHLHVTYTCTAISIV